MRWFYSLFFFSLSIENIIKAIAYNLNRFYSNLCYGFYIYSDSFNLFFTRIIWQSTIIFNIQNALNSDTEMNITYRDYLKRRFKSVSLEPFPVFTFFFSTIHSIIKNRNKKRIYFGFFISPTHLR